MLNGGASVFSYILGCGDGVIITSLIKSLPSTSWTEMYVGHEVRICLKVMNHCANVNCVV